MVKAADLTDVEVVTFVADKSMEEVVRPTQEELTASLGLAAAWRALDRIGGPSYPQWVYVHQLEENWPWVPRKVILAKLRKLDRRGLLDACSCGCRGDIMVTPAGAELIGRPDLPIHPCALPYQGPDNRG